MKRLAVSLICVLITICCANLPAQEKKPVAPPVKKAETSKPEKDAKESPVKPGEKQSTDQAKKTTPAPNPPKKAEKNSGTKVTDKKTEVPADKKAEKSSSQKKSKDQSSLVKAEGEFARNSGDELLNMATDAKLTASSLRDLNKVIVLCQQAEKKGLSPENKDFCRQLRLSAQLQRGMAVGKLFLSDNMTLAQLPPNWEKHRTQILQDLNEVLKEDPEQPAAQLIVGRLHMLPPGNEQAAIQALDLAIKYALEEPVVLAEALKFRAELEKDDFKKEELLKRALPLTKDNASIFNAIAAHWISVKRFDKALEAAERAIKIEPDSLVYKRTRAYSLAGLGRFDEAEKCYSSAVDQGGNPLMTQVETAQFLAAIHKEDKALAIYDELINKYPIPVLYYYRAMIRLSQKDYKKAMNDVNQCLRLDMKMNEAIQLKGMVYLQQEKYEDAIRIFETLKNQNPNDLSCVCQLAYALAKKGDVDQALKTLTQRLAKEKEKDNPELLRCKGDIELMYGRWAETIVTYEIILKKHPKDSGVLNNYSWLLSTSPDKVVRNGKKSLEYALKAAELSYYAEAHILSTLGAAYAELGQFDNALKWSKKAVEIATRERHERLDDLKKECESYKAKKPWREIPEKLRDKKTTK